MKNLRIILVLTLFGAIMVGCGGNLVKQVPTNTDLKFALHDFKRIGKNKPAIIVNNKSARSVYDYHFKWANHRINNYESVIRAECGKRDGPKNDVFLCTLYKKIAGNIYDKGESTPSKKPKDWEVMSCGLFNGYRVINGKCSDLKVLLGKTIDGEFKRQEDYINAQKEEQQRKYKEEKERRKIAQKLWNNRLSVKLQKGQKVCTNEGSRFGYVEGISNKRVKVYVVGKVIYEYNPTRSYDGYFFSGSIGEFNYNKIEKMRWYKRNEIAACEFNM